MREVKERRDNPNGVLSGEKIGLQEEAEYVLLMRLQRGGGAGEGLEGGGGEGREALW